MQVQEESKTTYRISVAEYDRMIERDVFEDRKRPRLELIRGELQVMVPPNPPHENAVDTLMYWSLDHTDRTKIRVRVQQSVGIPPLDSVPEPDLAWMRQRNDYRTRRPQADDVLLLIEVSESSLSEDRNTKATVYAEAGITDYWIVNLVDDCIEVFRDPRDGVYHSVSTARRGEQISPLAAPNVVLSVDHALGY